MDKGSFLKRWKGIKPAQKLSPRVVPYKHKGSTFDQDGIRITGTPEFIDAVLSRMKDLIDFENGSTRLGVSMTEATDKNTQQKLGTYKCYIQVHERGPQAQMLNALCNRQ